MNKIGGGKPARFRASGYLCTVNNYTDKDVELLRGLQDEAVGQSGKRGPVK